MSLRVALAEKFPEIPEAEILKVTVNDLSLSGVLVAVHSAFVQE